MRGPNLHRIEHVEHLLVGWDTRRDAPANHAGYMMDDGGIKLLVGQLILGGSEFRNPLLHNRFGNAVDRVIVDAEGSQFAWQLNDQGGQFGAVGGLLQCGSGDVGAAGGIFRCLKPAEEAIGRTNISGFLGSITGCHQTIADLVNLALRQRDRCIGAA